jgi:uncharacterized protein YndB with AHSA1/START domain
MATSQPAQPLPPAARPRKRVLIPLLVLGLLALAVLVLVVRGTWADTVVKNPASSADGSVSQLYQSPDGRKQVRCARILDFPAAAVWKVVTDYNHFGEIFPYERDVTGEVQPDGRWRVRGVAHAWPYGEWPFDVYVTQQETPEGFTASWDDPGGALTANRGSWVVTPLGPDRTLLVLSLELEVHPFPAFYVRNALLHRLKGMLAAVDTRLRTPTP